MKSQHTTFPSLSGTLAKRSKQTLQPNFAKEPSSPSRSIARTERYCSKMKENSMTDKNGQLVTSCIVHLADSADFKGSTPIKLCSGLTGKCFENAKRHHTRNRYSPYHG